MKSPYQPPKASWKELTISLEGFDHHQLLAEWRWLVPETMSPLWLNRFGDWALKSPDATVYFLDILEGTFNCIASSELALNSLLESEENRNKWLMADWAGICGTRALHLSSGECFGWKIAPILGGKFEFSNIQVFYITVYESIMGQLHRQLKSFPEGYVITEFKIGDGSK